MSVSNSQWDFVRPIGDFTHTGVRDRAIHDEEHLETGRVDGGGVLASDVAKCDGGGNDGIE